MIRNVCSIKQYWFKACRRRCCNRIKSAWTQEFKQNFRNSQSYVCRSKDKNIFYRIKNPQTTYLRNLRNLIMLRQMGQLEPSHAIILCKTIVTEAWDLEKPAAFRFCVILVCIKNNENTLTSILIVLVRQMGLEPIRRRHTPLKRACLPIPALPHILNYIVLLTTLIIIAQ